MEKIIWIALFLMLSGASFAQDESDSITYKIENQTVLKNTFDELNAKIKLAVGGSCSKTTCGGVWSMSGKDDSGQEWVYRHVICNALQSYELQKVK